MFKIFRKRRDQVSPMNTLWHKVGNKINKRQRSLADLLSRKAQHWPVWYIKIGLAVFCLVFGGMSTFYLVSAFHGSGGKITIEKISVPQNVVQKDTLERRNNLELIDSTREYRRIVQFRQYMDSLKADVSGKKVYDSIMRVRPGFMDSLLMAESFFKRKK